MRWPWLYARLYHAVSRLSLPFLVTTGLPTLEICLLVRCVVQPPLLDFDIPLNCFSVALSDYSSRRWHAAPIPPGRYISLSCIGYASQSSLLDEDMVYGMLQHKT